MSLFDIFKKARTAGSDGPSLRISPTDYMREHSGNGVVVDVRTPSEFGMGHINGATNIDISSADFAKQISELGRDDVFYLYCRSGARSQRAAEAMHKAGFKAFNIGGLQELQSAGADVVE